jgi:peptide/nickel transport system permease protein
MSAIPAAATGGRTRSEWRRQLERFVRNRAALFGVCSLAVLLAVAAGANVIAPHGPFELSSDTLAAPGGAYALGSDQLGRDVLSRVLFGTRVTLLVGLSAALIAVTIGALIGAIAGYFGGWADSLLMRLVELFQVLPSFFLAIMIVSVFGPGVAKVIVVIGVLSWPRAARLARAQFLTLKEQNFVAAARTLGLGNAAIIVGEMLPNAASPLLVQGSLDVAAAILTEAGLGFLGLSDPTVLTRGAMLQDAQRHLLDAWWIAMFPGLAICLTVMAFNLIGDGLNDMLNPRLRNLRRWTR